MHNISYQKLSLLENLLQRSNPLISPILIKIKVENWVHLFGYDKTLKMVERGYRIS